ncbi:MAG: alpha/beta fold hydrolase [Chloroflexota bacterium]
MVNATPKPSILFIHGAWHGKWCYEEHFLSYFQEQGFDTHAIDLPEHGEKFTSLANQRWQSIANYVQAIADYVAAMPEPPIIVGHSMGGFVVQKYLEEHPAKAGVLLASVSPAGVLGITLKMARHHTFRFLQTIWTMNLWPLVSDPQLARAHFFSPSIPPADLQKYAQKLNGESFRAFLDMLLLNLPRAKRVSVPMLILGAANDTIFTQKEIQVTASMYQTNATIFPNMAHDMMLEPDWQNVADTIITWIHTTLV